METLGQKLNPILLEIEGTLLDHAADAELRGQPHFTDEGFRAASQIFFSALMDKMYSLQLKENMSLEEKCNMVESAGHELRALVKTYTDIDTHELYK